MTAGKFHATDALHEESCPACKEVFGGDSALDAALLLFAHLKANKGQDADHMRAFLAGQEKIRESCPVLPQGGCA